MEPFPILRAKSIHGLAREIFSRAKIRVCFRPSRETDFIQYFSGELDSDLRSIATERIEVKFGGDIRAADILVISAHGTEIAGDIWNMRMQGYRGLLAGWFWDNHVSHVVNLHVALAFDFVFPSHNHTSFVIANPVSILGAHTPACCAQWARHELSTLGREVALSTSRSSQLLCPYVSYDFASRTEFLRQLAVEMPEADVLLMPPDDRSRYFGRNRLERFREWASYKCSLVLPVSRDLSTRVFDALAAGQTVVVGEPVPDLDLVIPSSLQKQLGIFVTAQRSVEAIREAYERAIEHFDRHGNDGVIKRQTFILDNHMVSNRLATMISSMERFGKPGARVEFNQRDDSPPALLSV